MRKIVYKIGRILTIKSLSGKKTSEGFLLFAVFYRNRPARLSLRERAIRKGCSFCMMRGKLLNGRKGRKGVFALCYIIKGSHVF